MFAYPVVDDFGSDTAMFHYDIKPPLLEKG